MKKDLKVAIEYKNLDEFIEKVTIVKHLAEKLQEATEDMNNFKIEFNSRVLED